MHSEDKFYAIDKPFLCFHIKNNNLTELKSRYTCKRTIYTTSFGKLLKR